nr:hypothetical protein CFP56_39882 [Quercus suber]
MVADSRHSSIRSRRPLTSSPFWVWSKPSTRALQRFTLAGITASALYVKENGVSPVDLLAVVRYVHKMLGSSSANLPFVPSNLFFSPLRITLLVASA